LQRALRKLQASLQKLQVALQKLQVALQKLQPQAVFRFAGCEAGRLPVAAGEFPSADAGKDIPPKDPVPVSSSEE
jgi:hypothetical protein